MLCPNATFALGCLPLHAAVPPVQCPIESNFQSGMDGLDHTGWAENCGNTISDWLKTGTWVNVPSGAAGTWT